MICAVPRQCQTLREDEDWLNGQAIARPLDLFEPRLSSDIQSYALARHLLLRRCRPSRPGPGRGGTLPTATDSAVAGKQFRLGPEALIAKFEKWGVYGLFPSHQWDVTGWGGGSFSTSQLQGVLKFLPGGGWNVGTSPIMNYDWANNQWSIPLNLTVGKTVTLGSTPVKLELEVNYYVKQIDAFGPEWMIGINITPVVNNFIEGWIRGN